MKSLGSFSFSPKLQSSVFFSLCYLIASSALIGLISKKKSLAKTNAIFFAVYMFVCFILITINGMGVDYRLSAGLAHYLEDLFLSPFFILVFIVIIKAFKLDQQSAKEK
jgi:Mn2+/Fe2+ NRAMP family transporter